MTIHCINFNVFICNVKHFKPPSPFIDLIGFWAITNCCIILIYKLFILHKTILFRPLWTVTIGTQSFIVDASTRSSNIYIRLTAAFKCLILQLQSGLNKSSGFSQVIYYDNISITILDLTNKYITFCSFSYRSVV